MIGELRGHLNRLNEVYRVPNAFRLLYRVFYYDARPLLGKAHTPVDHRPIDYAQTTQGLFRMFKALRDIPNLTVRLGEVRREGDRSWILKARPQQRLLDAPGGRVDWPISFRRRQKGVDMRIGLDIASETRLESFSFRRRRPGGSKAGRRSIPSEGVSDLRPGSPKRSLSAPVA